MQNESTHSMKRRSPGNNYNAPGTYHITLTVHDRKAQSLGVIKGDLQYPDGHPNGPRVELSALGRMVEDELLHSITEHYPVIEIQDYVIMPEHMHFLAVVKHSLISKNGHTTHLGQVIAGFKSGCNRRYWEITGQRDIAAAGATAEGEVAAKPLPTMGAAGPSASGVAGGGAAGGGAAGGGAAGGGAAGGGAAGDGGAASGAAGGGAAGGGAAGGGAASGVAGGFVASAPEAGAKKLRYSSGRSPLFSEGYVDVIPLKEGQLETQRAYIHANPRNRLLRQNNPTGLHPQRKVVDTLVTPSALRGYLEREGALSDQDQEAWEALRTRLLIDNSHIYCDGYGYAQLLERLLLPVVCHRKDLRLFAQHKQQCLDAASQGAILVSARIARGEQDIMDEALRRSFPVILIVDNGFPPIYHPSEARLSLCASNQLLLLSPWAFRYQHNNEEITVAECKAMNCIAQALCHKKDDWWK